MSSTGEPYVITRGAKDMLKTDCDHIFGGDHWLKLLIQMGGCPTEFVDATNFVTNQRLEVALKK